MGCDTCLVGAAALLLAGINGCAPAYPVFKTTVTGNTIEVPLPLFDLHPMQVVRPKGWQYDIAVQKNADGTFTALLMQCTHLDNQLAPSQNGYHCSLHGSRFNKAGKVIKGPAEAPLKSYPTSTANNHLLISI